MTTIFTANIILVIRVYEVGFVGCVGNKVSLQNTEVIFVIMKSSYCRTKELFIGAIREIIKR